MQLNKLQIRFLSCAAVLCLVAAFSSLPEKPRFLKVKDPSSCLYIPGGGFSGFFYTMGRLQGKAKKESDVAYYCYSAGCLATTATLADISVSEVYEKALDIQMQWRAGAITRFQVVEEFVDYVLSTGNDRTLDETALARLHVITSEDVAFEKAWFPKLQTTVRAPQSLEELRTMLLQTMWIPGATGNGLMLNQHLDGGFTTADHPRCPSSLSLPKLTWTWKSLEFHANLLGYNMSQEQSERFWGYGAELGH